MNQTGRLWSVSLTRAWVTEDTATATALLLLQLPKITIEQFSAPAEFHVNVTLDSRSNALFLTAAWRNRTLSRMPSAFFMNFNPLVPRPYQNHGWKLDVLGTLVDPLSVTHNGAKRLNAIERGVCLDGDGVRMRIESLDAVLVSPGDTDLTNWDNHEPPVDKGMHFVLYDNANWDCIWSSNNEDYSFRFVVYPDLPCWPQGLQRVPSTTAYV